MVKLEKEKVQKVIQLLAKHDFLNIRVKERMGVPDEARPHISLYLAEKNPKTIAKWANDKHKDFDAIYQHLLNLAKEAAKAEPVKTGAYDHKWRPKRFLKKQKDD